LSPHRGLVFVSRLPGVIHGPVATRPGHRYAAFVLWPGQIVSNAGFPSTILLTAGGEGLGLYSATPLWPGARRGPACRVHAGLKIPDRGGVVFTIAASGTRFFLPKRAAGRFFVSSKGSCKGHRRPLQPTWTAGEQPPVVAVGSCLHQSKGLRARSASSSQKPDTIQAGTFMGKARNKKRGDRAAHVAVPAMVPPPPGACRKLQWYAHNQGSG